MNPLSELKSSSRCAFILKAPVQAIHKQRQSGGVSGLLRLADHRQELSALPGLLCQPGGHGCILLRHGSPGRRCGMFPDIGPVFLLRLRPQSRWETEAAKGQL